MQTISKETVLIFDFGSQYSQLIARRVRELNVFSEIVSHQLSADEVKKTAPVGIILSGGPSSVYDEGAPGIDAEIFELGIPILGICYGMQLGCNVLGGKVENAQGREYGRANLSVNLSAELFEGLGDSVEVWMSHGDIVTTLTGDFETLAHTANSPFSAVRHKTHPFYGSQCGNDL